jgi:hypothetical protein
LLASAPLQKNPSRISLELPETKRLSVELSVTA